MNEQWAGGKGYRPRKLNVELYDIGYDMAFGKTPELREAAKERWLDYSARPPRMDDKATD